MQGSECTSTGLSSSGLSNYKRDPESPSAHKHKNSCQTTLCFSLSVFFLSLYLSLSSSSRLINSSPYRFVRNLFFSGFLCGLDFRQNVRYWWTHSEGTGCGVFCISLFWFQRSYLIFVYRNNVDSCATAGWLLAPPWTHPGSATGPDQHCQMPSGSAGVANQRHRKWNQLLTNSKPLFEFICWFIFLWWLWGVYWPRADSVRLARVPAGPLDWCPSLTVFRSDTHLIKQAGFINFRRGQPIREVAVTRETTCAQPTKISMY